MIINSANKFVEKLDRWSTFFNVVYWVLALIPLGIFILITLAEGPPPGFGGLIFFFAFIIYLAAAVFVHRLTLLGFEFMKAIVTTALECQQELVRIRSELKKPLPEQEQFEAPARQSPFNFEN